MTIRGIKWILVVKGSWLAANFTVWLLGLGSCMSNTSCAVARTILFPVLFLLSFPGSMLFFLINELLIETGFAFDVTPAMKFTFLSLGTLTVGYIQWFHVLPAVIGQRGVTVLSLNQPSTASAVAQKIPAMSARQEQVKATLIQPFDKAGRTPLERVINRKQSRRLTNAS